jgi:hypothetical protein
MGILNTITKTVMTLGLVTAPIMLAAGLGFIEDCPAALIKGNGGTGADKAEWGAAPGAGGWPQTVISSLAKGACCGCCTTPKALAVAALQRLWRGPRCHRNLRQVAAIRRGVPGHNARQRAHPARRVQAPGAP